MKFKTDISYRKETLTKLLSVINKHEKDIIQALYDDFKKPEFEAVVTETAYVVSDLKHTIRNLRSWAKPRRVFPSILNFPSSDFIYSEPYGKVLVIAPWNYPFQLALCPVIAAVAAGNQVIVKPSELTTNTASIIELIIAETFDPVHVEVYQGGAEVTAGLLQRRWDYIFFTGSVVVGKIVAEAAAKNLTPVTLELGGKNPCIVDETANLRVTAKRIVWGKFINAGQTCIAPDYILAQKNIKPKLIELLIEEIEFAYGKNPESSPDFARIISERHVHRLHDLIDFGKVAYGGKISLENKYISPTIIDEPAPESVIRSEEIFGPLLPIIAYSSEDDVQKEIMKHEKPLSLYVFTENKKFAEKMIAAYSYGGGCINDTVVHFSNNRLPFGGVGQSGSGAYHGKLGFETFSHRKAIVKKPTWLDIPMRYAPYGKKLKTVRNLMKWF
ncbi:MAG TPA: aldehyde dehydrogenase [Flavobacterium sp.]|jgi:aldehyde dehydrogenase (NAD+)